MKLLPEELPSLRPEQVVEVAEILRLLGEPSRLRILLACLAEPAPVGELAARVGIPRALGRATHPSVPAPSRLFVGRLKRDMFIQGLIVDDSSPRGLSVTNGIKVDVE